MRAYHEKVLRSLGRFTNTWLAAPGMDYDEEERKAFIAELERARQIVESKPQENEHDRG